MSYRYTRSQPYRPGQEAPYKLSRSKLELFMQCPRCFWLDNRLKISRPSSPPFRINSAIDELLKREFDVYRAQKKPHPIMIEYKVDAIPFMHEKLDEWRANFSGVATTHAPTNFYVFGAVDDVWVDDEGKLVVVDYKATAKDREVTIDADWQIAYKRQLEIYQWLFRQNGFEVADTAYFVYANGRLDAKEFDNKVEFKTKLIPYQGDTSWIEPTLERIKEVLNADMPPVGKAAMGGVCDFCSYARSRTELTLDAIKNQQAQK